MKTKLFYFLALVLMLTCLSNTARADVKLTFSYKGLYYEVDESDHATVIKPTSGKYSGDITVPRYAIHNNEAYMVVAIGDNAFKGATGVTSVTLPLSGIGTIR